MLPFEFVVMGPPISQQAHRRSARRRVWRAAVRAAAAARLSGDFSPVEQDVTVQITHFYEGAPADVDNIAKPILDAMKGLVFGDDSQITDLFCRRRRIRGPFSIDPMSLLIADVIATGGEFVHVRVAASHPTGELRFL